MDKVVIRETLVMAVWMLIFSAIMQAVFLVIGKWDYTVLLGNLLSYTAMVLNFLAVGVMVQKAVLKDPKDAKLYVRAMGGIRMVAIFAVLVVGIVLDVFNIWTVVIPVFFPRLIVMILPLMGKKSEPKEELSHGYDGDEYGENDSKAEDVTPEGTLEA